MKMAMMTMMLTLLMMMVMMMVMMTIMHRCYVGPMTVKRKDFTPVTSGPRALVKRFQNNHSR